MPRRSYDHFCAVSRALDVVGDRWSLLVVRELSAGPRRYSDLFADLPGISTDVLAARLKDLERDGILVRRRSGARATTSMYELSDTGRGLRPVLDALSTWGAPLLGERGSTDAVRAHWFALPLGRAVADLVGEGTVSVGVGETTFHYVITTYGAVTHHDGPAAAPDFEFHLDVANAAAVVAGESALVDLATCSYPLDSK